MGVSIYPAHQTSEQEWETYDDLYSTHITASTWGHVAMLLGYPLNQDDVWSGSLPLWDAIDAVTAFRKDPQMDDERYYDMSEEDRYMYDKAVRFINQLALQWREARDLGATEIRWS